VNVGGPNVQTLAPPRVHVDLQLKGMVGGVTPNRSLVVDDGECGRMSVFLVKDDVGPSGDGYSLEMQFERPLGLPDSVQVTLVLARVGCD
jgi:hypothetical protein